MTDWMQDHDDTQGPLTQESSGPRSSLGQDEEPADKGILYL